MLGPARAVKSAGSADMVAQTLADFVRRDGEGLRQARAGRRGTAGPVAEDGAGGGDPVGRLWESTAALADVVAATAYAPGPESRLTRRAELARRLAEAEALVWEAGMDVPVDAGAAEAAADVAGLAHASWWRGGDLGPRLTALERMEAALAQLSVEPQTTGKVSCQRDTVRCTAVFERVPIASICGAACPDGPFSTSRESFLCRETRLSPWYGTAGQLRMSRRQALPPPPRVTCGARAPASLP